MKEVLKEADYKKVVSIVEVIDAQGDITPEKAKRICRKSETTTWRYLNMLTNTGYVVSEGSANNVFYKRSENNRKMYGLDNTDIREPIRIVLKEYFD